MPLCRVDLVDFVLLIVGCVHFVAMFCIYICKYKTCRRSSFVYNRRTSYRSYYCSTHFSFSVSVNLSRFPFSSLFSFVWRSSSRLPINHALLRTPYAVLFRFGPECWLSNRLYITVVAFNMGGSVSFVKKSACT